MESLISLGADVNLKNEKGRGPLHVAVRWESKGIFLKFQKSVLSMNHNSAFSDPGDKIEDRIVVITRLIDNGAIVDLKDNKGQSALHRAAKHPSKSKMCSLGIQNVMISNYFFDRSWKNH